ncbi:penicillin-binding protein activator [Sandarakinorhabdus sp.]|uniref:penicillin-binding protein activator n=1 Tax=Sandarakinorhabdus sp. TaxID=1916663 RepID=UPI003342C763
MAIKSGLGSGWQVLQPVLLTFGLLVAACAPVRKPPPVLPPPPPPVVTQAPRPAVLPAARLNKVALLVPLSGANAALGETIANAAALAMTDLGKPQLQLVTYDSAVGAGEAAAKAITDGAGLILGPLLGSDVPAVSAAVAGRPVPILSFSNDAGVAGGDVFVMGFQPGQAISRVIAYARSRGVERFAALVPQGAYGQRAQLAFVKAVNDAGGRSTAVVSYGRDPEKLVAAARQVTNHDARLRASGKPVIRADGTVARVAGALAPVPFQALMIADSGSAAVRLLPPLARFGAVPGQMVILGTELWNNEPGLARIPALKGAIYATVSDARFNQLAVRYRQKHGGNPSRLASLGYDAVLLANSLAARWPLGQAFPRSALLARDGFSGIDGAFRFTAAGVAERALEVDQIGTGVASPAPTSF